MCVYIYIYIYIYISPKFLNQADSAASRHQGPDAAT